jgi:ADP-ribosylglycohydrolase
MRMTLQEKIYGSIMGTALGDSIGLPFEGLSRSKIAKKNPTFEKQSLLFNRGMFSDDTEHTIMVAQSLIESNGSVEVFQKLMQKRLKLRFLALPAGVGLATARAIVKSFFSSKSGVFSAGNAPAMRSALLGVLYGDDEKKMQAFVHANTIITHTDPKAYYGALAVAKAAYLASIGQEEIFFEEMYRLVDDNEFKELLEKVEKSLEINTLEFAEQLGLEKGVGGYIYHTLPIVLHAWLRNQDNFEQAIMDVIRCGGDTDTTAAIVGSIIGAKTKQFPSEWLNGIIDHPCNIAFIEKVSLVLAEQNLSEPKKAPRLSALAILVRNMVFLMVVLVVGITRQF